MKKYVKPELFYEHYELSQHIADCVWEWQHLTSETLCYAIADDNVLWGFQGPDYYLFAPNSACTLTDQQLEDYCYENAALGTNLFKS